VGGGGAGQSILSRLSSIFTGGRKPSAPVKEIKKGTLQEIVFKSGIWQSSGNEAAMNE